MDSRHFYRWLTPQEIEKFRQWARDHFNPNMEVNLFWHPIVKDEWKKLQKEEMQCQHT